MRSKPVRIPLTSLVVLDSDSIIFKTWVPVPGISKNSSSLAMALRRDDSKKEYIYGFGPKDLRISIYDES